VFDNPTVADWILGDPWPGFKFPDWATLYALLGKNLEHGAECLARLQAEGAPTPQQAEQAFQAKLARTRPVLPTHEQAGAMGGRGKKGSYPITGFPGRGTSASYLARRLRRDRPDVFEAFERGDYPSLKAAARAAGIVRVPSLVDRMLALWSHASASERDEFLARVAGEHGSARSGAAEWQHGPHRAF
jgi:hypothetical protein